MDDTDGSRAMRGGVFACLCVTLVMGLLLTACQPRTTQQAAATPSPATEATSAPPPPGEASASGRSYPSNATPITEGFGVRSFSGSPFFQGSLDGVDIHAPKLTPALAVDFVEVLETGYRGQCGNMARVRSRSTETEYIYCHLNRIDVHRGDVAMPGQVIGLVGGSGRDMPSDQPRLRLVVLDGTGPTAKPRPPEQLLFGQADGRAICPDPDKIGKNPSDGGYSSRRSRDAQEAGEAVLFYPVCDLPGLEAVAKAPTSQLAPVVVELYQRFLTKPNPGAFAVSTDGRAAGYNYCSNATVCFQRRRMERRAVDYCQRYSHGVPCRVYSWRGQIVQ